MKLRGEVPAKFLEAEVTRLNAAVLNHMSTTCDRGRFGARESQDHAHWSPWTSVAILLGATAFIAVEAEMVSGTQMIVAETPNANAGMMRQWIDQLRKRSSEPIAILLANCVDDKVTLIAGISQTLVERGFSAGKWITPVAEKVGGGGGGKPDLAQAGGKLPAKLPEALQIAKDTWHSMLA